MNARTAIREALRNIVCASFAHALVLQLILGAIVSGAHASALSSGSESRGIICSSAGATPAPLDPADADHHQSGGDCCSLGCAAPAPSAPPPAQILSAVLSPDRLRGADSRHWAEASIRGPPLRSAPQTPRAPPIMS